MNNPGGMKAICFDKHLYYESDRPLPPPESGECLLRIRLAGICSTDVEITRGYMGFTGVLGHEFVADVVESPNKGVIGRRVVGEINAVCHRCDQCLAGRMNHCRHRTVMGILGRDGAFAEYARLPLENLHRVPEDVDDESAVYVEPLAAAARVVEQVGTANAENIQATVLGDGRLGLLTAQVMRYAGYITHLVGRHESKLSLGRKWGIDAELAESYVPRHDQDVVVDCTGSAVGLSLAMAAVRPAGTIVLKTTVAAGKPINLAPVVVHEVKVIGSRCGPFDKAIELLRQDAIDVKALTHGVYTLDHGVEAMRTAATPGVLKVLLRP